jgi:hypothetical protein
MDSLTKERVKLRQRIANILKREGICKTEQAQVAVNEAKCAEEVVRLRSKFECEKNKDACLIEKHEARC